MPSEHIVDGHYFQQLRYILLWVTKVIKRICLFSPDFGGFYRPFSENYGFSPLIPP